MAPFAVHNISYPSDAPLVAWRGDPFFHSVEQDDVAGKRVGPPPVEASVERKRARTATAVQLAIAVVCGRVIDRTIAMHPGGRAEMPN
jgi:hypothetical protein